MQNHHTSHAGKVTAITFLAFSTLLSFSGWAQSQSVQLKPHLLNPQKMLDMPHIRTCVDVLKCEDGSSALSLDENRILTMIMSAIKAGSTEAQISEAFARKPYAQSPSDHSRSSDRLRVSGAEWYVSESASVGGPARPLIDSHVRVVFVNDSAVRFRWLTDGMKKSVEVTFFR
ncbi:MAG TPA: hypothetical protein VIF60_13435 [Burkholderiaceae bacterium]|jgi:hypothetical protein